MTEQQSGKWKLLSAEWRISQDTKSCIFVNEKPSERETPYQRNNNTLFTRTKTPIHLVKKVTLWNLHSLTNTTENNAIKIYAKQIE